MVIGIKYCGGCNSTYDRADAVKKLMAAYPQHTWVYAAHGERIADYWLCVCGCPAVCASTDGLIAHKELILLASLADFKSLQEKLR